MAGLRVLVAPRHRAAAADVAALLALRRRDAGAGSHFCAASRERTSLLQNADEKFGGSKPSVNFLIETQIEIKFEPGLYSFL